MARSLLAWFLFIALGPYGVAYACSCRPGTTLEQQYEQADNILIAKISGCTPARLSADGSCRAHGWTFDTIEDLKGSHAAVKTQPFDAGPVMSTCDLSLKVGETYLLFLSDGRTGQCSGTRPLGDEVVADEIEVLRAYRDGAITRVTSAWHFADNGSMCTIRHQLPDVSMTFNYQYQRSQMELAQGADALTRPILNMTLMPSAAFDFAGPTLLEVDGKSVPLTRITGRLPRSVDIVTGDAVMELLDAMTHSVEVVVSGERSTYIAPSKHIGPVQTFRATTRTDLIEKAAGAFKACVEAHPR